MPHCYAHPTLYSTQQLVVPVKNYISNGDWKSEMKKRSAYVDARFWKLKLTNGLSELLQLVDGIWKSVLNKNANANWNAELKLQFQKKFLQTGKSFFSQKTRTSRFGTKQVEKVYRRTPPYLTYIGDSIDQGATRLGGVIDQYICLQMGAPLFLLALLSIQTQEVCKAFLFKSKVYLQKNCWSHSRFIFSSQLFTFVV